MKKTLIALIALAGVAVAGESLTLTTGIKYNDTVYNGYTDPNVTGLEYTYAGYPGYTSSSISFTIALGELYGADEILSSDVITLNSLTLKVNSNGWSLDGNRAITLSIEGNTAYSYSQKLANNTTYVNRDGAELTMSNINWSGLTTDSVITLTLGGDEGHTIALASITSGEWQGVSTIDASGWTTNASSTSVDTGAPLVSLSVTTAPVPEPATATLSLLALCGLAARRRRK